MALKVSARNIIGEIGSLCQEVCEGIEEACYTLQAGGEMGKDFPYRQEGGATKRPACVGNSLPHPTLGLSGLLMSEISSGH